MVVGHRYRIALSWGTTAPCQQPMRCRPCPSSWPSNSFQNLNLNGIQSGHSYILHESSDVPWCHAPMNTAQSQRLSPSGTRTRRTSFLHAWTLAPWGASVNIGTGTIMSHDFPNCMPVLLTVWRYSTGMRLTAFNYKSRFAVLLSVNYLQFSLQGPAAKF